MNELYFPSKFNNYLVVHEEPEHITYFCMDSFVYRKVFFFPLIDFVQYKINEHKMHLLNMSHNIIL